MSTKLISNFEKMKSKDACFIDEPF